MEPKETTTCPINEETKMKKEESKTTRDSLYLDQSLLQRESFLQYLAALVLGKKRGS